MNRRYEYKRKQSKIKELIVSHLENNIKEYTIISIIFFIGIIIGIIFINKTSETQISEINNYIYTFVQDLKNDSNINELLLLKDSLRKNCVLAIFLWFMGSTVIGISIVYITICFRGFCLGYTISSIISSYGFGKGILFLSSTILLQNILFIPCIIVLAVSGMKLHNSIMKDKRRENIKLEILRHTIISLFILFILIFSSFVEVYVSKNLLISIVKYL